MNDATINARVDDQLKRDALKVLARVDVSMTDAIRMFLRQVVLHEGLPFDVRIPNKATRDAIKETRKGGGKVFSGDTASILKAAATDDA